MAYDIDQCAQCGGIRVAKSTLCADCLVACNCRLNDKYEAIKIKRENFEYNTALALGRKDEEIRELKYRLRLRMKVLQKVFEEYQKILRLYKRDGVVMEAIDRIFR